jgi:pilus assembly protein FimV
LDFNADVAQQDETEFEQENIKIAALKGIDLSFGGPDLQTPHQVEASKYDLPMIESSIDPTAAQVSMLEPVPVNHFDLSTISLDLSNAAPNTAAPERADAFEVAVLPTVSIETKALPEQPTILTKDEVNEHPDVDIKLDLVKVYIDMDDVEGARDLLDEVIKEGGPKQRQAAEKILASLT